MKKSQKIFCLLLISVFSAVSANAGIRFGIKAGLNINELQFDKNELFKSDNRCGWTAGVMAEGVIPLVGIGFDASVMYTRMNAEAITKDVTPASLLTGFKSESLGKDFIEIPINVKYKLSLPMIAQYVQPYVYTGPSFAFKVSKHTLDDFKSKTCQVAWNLGLGVELIRHLQVQASYGFGINNVANYVAPVNTVSDIKAKNSYWTVTAAYLF